MGPLSLGPGGWVWVGVSVCDFSLCIHEALRGGGVCVGGCVGEWVWLCGWVGGWVGVHAFCTALHPQLGPGNDTDTGSASAQ